MQTAVVAFALGGVVTLACIFGLLRLDWKTSAAEMAADIKRQRR